MFWSKIWFFLVAVAAVLGIGVALTVPRPAERKVMATEDTRLEQAMESVRFYLMLEARNHVDVAMQYARHEIYVELKKIKEDAASAEAIAQQLHDSARSTLDAILAKTQRQKPQLLIALDAWGRVVARAGLDEKEWGDDLSGYWLVRDALRGYMRDDLWLVGGKVYRVAAAPVIAQPAEGPESYVGALVVGFVLDEAEARNLSAIASSHACGGAGGEACDTHVAFFARGETLANSGPTTLASTIKQELARRGAELSAQSHVIFDVSGEAASYRVVAKRLPGEIGLQDGAYAVYSERPRGTGLFGALQGMVKDDLSPSSFPWLPLGAGFIAALLVGLMLMHVESDRPLKRLVRDALLIGKGEKKAFSEELHTGKHGSIARSVNLALEKLGREKAQRRDLGALYATEDSSQSEAVRPLPPAGPHGPPGSPWSPPPPSDFALEPGGARRSAASYDYAVEPPPPALSAASPRTGRTPLTGLPSIAMPPEARPARQAVAAAPNELPMHELPRPSRQSPPPPAAGRAQPARPAPPVHAPLPPPLPPPPGPSPLSALDDDILGHSEDAQMITPPPADVPYATGAAGSSSVSVTTAPAVAESAPALVRQQATSEGEAAYFHQVYDDFIELKRKCGESIDALTFDKFLGKLVQNRDQLIAKYACKAVRFQVYVKDGKAALKATPVKG